MRKLPLLLLLLLAAAVIGACGGATAAPSGVATLESDAPGASADTASPSASVDPEDAMLEFARCMREHGVDIPDPGPAAGGPIAVGPDDVDPEKFQAADEACRHHLEGVISEGGPQLTPEQEDAMLEFAECMREHGVDMPDPQDGAFLIPVGSEGEGGAPDPNDSTFREAEEACRHLMTDLFPGAGEGGEGAVPAAPLGGNDQ